MWFILAKFIPQRLYVAALSFSLGPLIEVLYTTMELDSILRLNFCAPWVSGARDFDDLSFIITYLAARSICSQVSKPVDQEESDVNGSTTPDFEEAIWQKIFMDLSYI